MGRLARLNPRSREGGKPKAYCSLHRVWRGVEFYKDDRAGFDQWIESRNVGDIDRIGLEKIWSEQNPQPRVSLA